MGLEARHRLPEPCAIPLPNFPIETAIATSGKSATIRSVVGSASSDYTTTLLESQGGKPAITLTTCTFHLLEKRACYAWYPAGEYTDATRIIQAWKFQSETSERGSDSLQYFIKADLIDLARPRKNSAALEKLRDQLDEHLTLEKRA